MIWLVRRGPREAHHLAPFHPVIVCAKSRIARSEAGWTGDAAWVWSHERPSRIGGWLLERWNGFNVDYGHVVRPCRMPDGTDGAFVHEHTRREPWSILAGAVWWDDRRMPKWLAEGGAIYPPDRFTQQRVLDAIADDGASGFGRERPAHWPAPEPLQTWEIAGEPRIPNGASVAYTTGIGCYAQPAMGVVEALTATVELPNGRYQDEYLIRQSDGTTTRRWRHIIEKQNPDLVRDGAA